MKIVHIEDRFHPEMGYQINFFAKYHNPEHEFIIVSSDSLSIWNNAISKEQLNALDKDFEAKYKVKIIRLSTKYERKGKYNLWLGDLFSTLNSLKPDVIYTHAFETWTSLRVLLGSKFLNAKLIVTDTHTLYNQYNSSFLHKIYISMLAMVAEFQLKNKNRILFATATENYEIANKMYGIPTNNLDYSLIGTDSEAYYFDENARSEIRTELQIPANAVVLLYAGKLNKLKAPHLILEALNQAKQSIENLQLLFVGAADNEYMEQVMEPLLKKSNYPYKIIPAVKSNMLYKYYSAVEFAVFPKENTLSALDVQLCKRPLIMENDLTNSERLAHGGLLYDAGNLMQLYNCIEKLASDTQLRNDLSDKGYVFINENYSYKNIIKHTEETIENALTKE